MRLGGRIQIAFALIPSLCQPFVLSPSTKLRTGLSKPVVSSVEPDAAGILKTGLSKPVVSSVEPETADATALSRLRFYRTDGQDTHPLSLPGLWLPDPSLDGSLP
jgi:hypothetical protein